MVGCLKAHSLGTKSQGYQSKALAHDNLCLEAVAHTWIFWKSSLNSKRERDTLKRENKKEEKEKK